MAENDRVIDEQDAQEIKNLYKQKVLRAFAVKSSGGVYNGQRWEPRADPSNPRPLLVRTGNLLHSIRNADVGWDGRDDFTIENEVRPYRGKNISTREVLLLHQYGTAKMPARPVISDLELNDLEDIRTLIDRKTKKREERWYKRYYDAFIRTVRNILTRR
jgi:hypothetical protein